MGRKYQLRPLPPLREGADLAEVVRVKAVKVRMGRAGEDKGEEVLAEEGQGKSPTAVAGRRRQPRQRARHLL
jgi:hypothetical protein